MNVVRMCRVVSDQELLFSVVRVYHTVKSLFTYINKHTEQIINVWTKT